MSSPSDTFECRWRPSRVLLAAYLATQGLSLSAMLLTNLPLWVRATGVLLCGLHALSALPRHILLSNSSSVRGLRHDGSGWRLFSEEHGWQGVRLLPDSLALPGLIVLRFRRPGGVSDSICIPLDALPADQHRRLRVRLKFSRNRWSSPQ